MNPREVEIRLAYAIAEALDHLSNQLWVHYGEDFLNLPEEPDITDPRKQIKNPFENMDNLF